MSEISKLQQRLKERLRAVCAQCALLINRVHQIFTQLPEVIQSEEKISENLDIYTCLVM